MLIGMLRFRLIGTLIFCLSELVFVTTGWSLVDLNTPSERAKREHFRNNVSCINSTKPPGDKSTSEHAANSMFTEGQVVALQELIEPL